MCGIAGVIYKQPQHRKKIYQLLKKMCYVIAHRGPDDEGIYISPDNKVGLGSRRLSIIDVKGGHQPISNEDQSIWITYNGEVYNFQEIRSLLKNRHVFKTNSDTEVILHLYEEKKEGCLKYLNGMFAFAIWDQKEKTLFAARDRLGKKPFSYYLDDNMFIFASEIKAILEEPSVPRQVEPKAIGYYFTYLYTPPPISMFKNIFKLSPAHYLIYKDGKLKVERYWNIRIAVENKTEEEYSQELFYLLSDATKLRLISEVPLGAILSGGIDSSIVTSLMALQSSDRVKTFTIDFQEPFFSEAKYARVVASKFNTQHYEFTVKPETVDILPKLVWHYDEPFGDSSMLPTYYVCKIARQFVTVALSGDGGDENFAGYPRIWIIDKIARFKKVPGIFQSFFSKLLQEYKIGRIISLAPLARSRLWKIERLANIFGKTLAEIYSQMYSYFNPDLKAMIFNIDWEDGRVNNLISSLFDLRSDADIINRACSVDLVSYLPFDILVKVDIASMANSLEVRCPFLDYRVVESAFKIPGRLKYKNGISKYILKKTFEGIVPKENLYRGKMGFGVPIGSWFVMELKDMIFDVVLGRKAIQRGYWKKESAQRFVNLFLSGRYDLADHIWLLLIFELWHQIYIDK